MTEKVNAVAAISIHALREESDALALTMFLVTSISIHALREESDILFYILIGVVIDFNPRSP